MALGRNVGQCLTSAERRDLGFDPFADHIKADLASVHRFRVTVAPLIRGRKIEFITPPFDDRPLNLPSLHSRREVPRFRDLPAILLVLLDSPVTPAFDSCRVRDSDLRSPSPVKQEVDKGRRERIKSGNLTVRTPVLLSDVRGCRFPFVSTDPTLDWTKSVGIPAPREPIAVNFTRFAIPLLLRGK